MAEKHVAVLLGGVSSERPVSLSSGNSCADALEAEGYRVTRVDVGRDLAAVLAELKPDVAFNALHGPFGEDGTVQGILEYLEIPYTHSGVLASALAMDKHKAKIVAKAAGIPTAESKVMNRFAIGPKHPMKPPYVIKPVCEGSSFGVVIVKEDQPHVPQIVGSSDWKYGDRVMVERFVHGGVVILLMAKATAVVFLVAVWLLGVDAWSIPLSAAGDAAMGIATFVLARRAGALPG